MWVRRVLEQSCTSEMHANGRRRSGSGLLRRMCTTRRNWMPSSGSKSVWRKDANIWYEAWNWTKIGHLRRRKRIRSSQNSILSFEGRYRGSEIQVNESYQIIAMHFFSNSAPVLDFPSYASCHSISFMLKNSSSVTSAHLRSKSAWIHPSDFSSSYTE
jgi:hypothetical protein